MTSDIRFLLTKFTKRDYVKNYIILRKWEIKDILNETQKTENAEKVPTLSCSTPIPQLVPSAGLAEAVVPPVVGPRGLLLRGWRGGNRLLAARPQPAIKFGQVGDERKNVGFLRINFFATDILLRIISISVFDIYMEVSNPIARQILTPVNISENFICKSIEKGTKHVHLQICEVILEGCIFLDVQVYNSQ